MTPDEMVAAVVREGGFDTNAANLDTSVILGWLNEKLRELVGTSRWRRGVRELGLTVGGQSDYLIPEDVIDVESLRVGGGRPWMITGLRDLWELESGNGAFSGVPGVWAANYTDDGTDAATVKLFPVPAESGHAISSLCVLSASAMTLGGAAPAVPLDTHQGLVDGAIGLGLARIYERFSDAAVQEASFQEKVQMLSRRANSRVGAGPRRIRVRR